MTVVPPRTAHTALVAAVVVTQLLSRPWRATSDTHGVATPALCCCVLQLFTYGSVGGGLLSDKYVELEPQKGLFGGYNSVCC